MRAKATQNQEQLSHCSAGEPPELSMESKLVAETAGERTFAVIPDPGEEAFSTISDFAVKERFGTASLTALGAFSEATVGPVRSRKQGTPVGATM
jgi:hypothetical protein